jgi:hypothetical protein
MPVVGGDVVEESVVVAVEDTGGRPPLITDTVSILPAPCGPSTISVDSEINSLCPRFCSHGIGVRSAPPRDSSEPSVLGGVDVVPFKSPGALGSTAWGSGNMFKGDETETTLSKARR